MAPTGLWRSRVQNMTDENGQEISAALQREHQRLQRELAQMRKACLEVFERLRVLHQGTLELEAERERLLSELWPIIMEHMGQAGGLRPDLLLDLMRRGYGTVLLPAPRFLQRESNLQQHAGPSSGRSSVHQSGQDAPQRYEAPPTMPPMPRFLGARQQPGPATPLGQTAAPARPTTMGQPAMVTSTMATAMPGTRRSMAAQVQVGPPRRQRPWREPAQFGEAGAFRAQRQWGAAMMAEARDRHRVSHRRQRRHRQRPAASTEDFGEAMRTMAAMVQQLPTAALAA